MVKKILLLSVLFLMGISHGKAQWTQKKKERVITNLVLGFWKRIKIIQIRD